MHSQTARRSCGWSGSNIQKYFVSLTEGQICVLLPRARLQGYMKTDVSLTLDNILAYYFMQQIL